MTDVPFLWQVGLPLVLVLIGMISGRFVERRHFESIERRERLALRLPAATFRGGFESDSVRRCELVRGSAVISIDYFKRLLAALRSLVGGRVRSYESLLDRARREAVLRMKESARGSSMIVNVRVETSNIGSTQGDDGIGCVEALAYGTAIWFER